MASGTRTPKSAKGKSARNYRHLESESPMRPEVGTQAQFKKKLPPKKYRYDDSLSPSLESDGQNPARERGEARVVRAEQELADASKGLTSSAKPEEIDATKKHLIAAQEAVRELKAMSKPFLNWAGKAERLSFEVPTLPPFIHERLSTKVILETLKGHKRAKQTDMFDLWGDSEHSIGDQVLRA
jgi:adenine-specific DNA-methyltransferase